MLHLEDGAMPGHLPSFAGETLEDALEFLGVGLDIKICKIKGKRSISTAFQQQSCWINRVDISWRNWELKFLRFMTFYDYRNIICMKVLSDMGCRFQWGHTDTFECQAGHAARSSLQKSGICNQSMAIQWPFNVTKSLNQRENWSFTGWKWGITKKSTHFSRCVCFRGSHRILGSGGMFWCQDANLYF